VGIIIHSAKPFILQGFCGFFFAFGTNLARKIFAADYLGSI
jgi:hypothetical protein